MFLRSCATSETVAIVNDDLQLRDARLNLLSRAKNSESLLAASSATTLIKNNSNCAVEPLVALVCFKEKKGATCFCKRAFGHESERDPLLFFSLPLRMLKMYLDLAALEGVAKMLEVVFEGFRGSRTFVVYSVVYVGEGVFEVFLGCERGQIWSFFVSLVWGCSGFLIAIGGDPVITEMAVLSMEEDVRAILEDSGLLPFVKKFSGHNEAITNQFVETWKNGKVTINGMHIDVSQLTKFIKKNKTLCWLDSGIARESLPQPWDRVAIQVMKYITLEGPAPPSLLLTSVNSESGVEEDSKSEGMVSPVIAPKEKEGKKRKLNDALAKSSRRSSRLQRKSAGKSNVIVDADSSDEEQKIDTAQGKIARSSPMKSATANPSKKGEGSPVDSQPPSEDFLGHLRILNSLSGTLTSTCACLNLLIVEITNYLKGAAKGKND
eukprot:Gb_23872 [translate_table: standard]